MLYTSLENLLDGQWWFRSQTSRFDTALERPIWMPMHCLTTLAQHWCYTVGRQWCYLLTVWAQVSLSSPLKLCFPSAKLRLLNISGKTQTCPKLFTTWKRTHSPRMRGKLDKWYWKVCSMTWWTESSSGKLLHLLSFVTAYLRRHMVVICWTFLIKEDLRDEKKGLVERNASWYQEVLPFLPSLCYMQGYRQSLRYPPTV